jgi:chaperonin cofactor prefoldin
MATDDLTTKPTIETILERLDDFRKSVDARFEGLEGKLEKEFADFKEQVGEQIQTFRNEVEDRLDSIEKQVVVIRKDQLDMRMDLRALHLELKEHLPLLK